MPVFDFLPHPGDGSGTETVLWQNSASTYSSGTISLSDQIANYKYIDIEYQVYTNLALNRVRYSTEEALKMTNAANTPKMTLGCYRSGNNYLRIAYVSGASGIEMSVCRQWNTSGGSTVSNILIPVAIYGIK